MIRAWSRLGQVRDRLNTEDVSDGGHFNKPIEIQVDKHHAQRKGEELSADAYKSMWRRMVAESRKLMELLYQPGLLTPETDRLMMTPVE